MRLPKRVQGRGGFTLVELMIVVALIGTLSAIAIPNFTSFQARGRRAEGYSNLASLSRSFIAYGAERGSYPDMLTDGLEPTLPDFTSYGYIGTRKLPWDADTRRFFDIVGWQSEGDVFYTYDVNSVSGCTCTFCFTATAHGDVDGDEEMGALMYVHPQKDAAGARLGDCPSRVGFPSPYLPLSGHDDEVAVVPYPLDEF